MDSNRELLKGNTPTLVLAVLKDGGLHGYGIAREIERRSDNALKFKEGTLYPALHTLEQDGLVAGEWLQESGGRSKKIYRITPAGLAELEKRTRVWNAFTSAVNSVMEGVENHAGTRTPAIEAV